MTYFLGRLVGRARGTASQIEPIVASRFEPVSPYDIPATGAPQVTQGGQGAATSPAIETRPHKTETQLRLSPARTVTESDSAERQSQPTPTSSKVELREADAAKNQSMLIQEESTEAPIKIARETLLVPQFREAASPLDLGLAQTPQAPTPAVVPPVQTEQNADVAEPARRSTAYDATQRKTSAIQVPMSSASLDVRQAETAQHPMPQKKRPRDSIAAPPVFVFDEQTRDQPTSQKVQLHLSAATTDLPLLRERFHEKHAARSTVRKQQPFALNSTPRLSPMTLREETREPAPIVHVTIGRIEVRAAKPPAPPPRQAARPPLTKLTLDAYLKSRKGVAR
jgi:hypothetical protein